MSVKFDESARFHSNRPNLISYSKMVSCEKFLISDKVYGLSALLNA